jgi:hypothetical protein
MSLRMSPARETLTNGSDSMGRPERSHACASHTSLALVRGRWLFLVRLQTRIGIDEHSLDVCHLGYLSLCRRIAAQLIGDDLCTAESVRSASGMWKLHWWAVLHGNCKVRRIVTPVAAGCGPCHRGGSVRQAERRHAGKVFAIPHVVTLFSY